MKPLEGWGRLTITNHKKEIYDLILVGNTVIMKTGLRGWLWRIRQRLRGRGPHTYFWTTQRTFLGILTGDTTVRRSRAFGDLAVSSHGSIYQAEELLEALDLGLTKVKEQEK